MANKEEIIKNILDDIRCTELDLSEKDLEKAKDEVVYLFDLEDYNEVTVPKIKKKLDALVSEREQDG